MAKVLSSEKALHYRVPIEADGSRADAIRATYEFLREATAFTVRYVLDTSPRGDYLLELRGAESTMLGCPPYYAFHAMSDCFYSEIVPLLRKKYEKFAIDVYLPDVLSRAHYVLSRRGIQLLRGVDVSGDDLLLLGYMRHMNYVVVGMPPLDYIFGKSSADGRFVLPTVLLDGDEPLDVLSRPVYYLKFSPLPPLHDFMKLLYKVAWSDSGAERHYFRLYSVGNRWYLSYRVTVSVYREILHSARVLLGDSFVHQVLRQLGTALLVLDARRAQSLIEDPLLVASREYGEMLSSRHRFRLSLDRYKRDSLPTVGGTEDEEDGDDDAEE